MTDRAITLPNYRIVEEGDGTLRITHLPTGNSVTYDGDDDELDITRAALQELAAGGVIQGTDAPDLVRLDGPNLSVNENGELEAPATDAESALEDHDHSETGDGGDTLRPQFVGTDLDPYDEGHGVDHTLQNPLTVESQSVSYGDEHGTLNSQTVALGHLAGAAHEDMTSVGYSAGRNHANEDGQSTFVGIWSGENSENRWTNALGCQTARDSTGGAFLVAVGNQALLRNDGGSKTAVGIAAGRDNTGSSTVMIGVTAGENASGSQNVFVGDDAGAECAGSEVVAIGERAYTGFPDTVDGEPYEAPTGVVAIGWTCARDYEGGSRAVYIGNAAARGASTTGNSTGIGFRALQHADGSRMTAVGRDAAQNSTEDRIAVFGSQAGEESSGHASAGIGQLALNGNSATHAVAAGSQAGRSNSGRGAVMLGGNSGRENSGEGAILIGEDAGYDAGATEPGHTSDGTVIIGYETVFDVPDAGIIDVDQFQTGAVNGHIADADLQEQKYTVDADETAGEFVIRYRDSEGNIQTGTVPFDE